MGKDKNAPKRSLSGYMLFGNAKRSEVTRKHPNLKMTEKSSVIAKMWKEATAAQKKPFEKTAAKDKKRYHDEMAAYRETPEFAAFQNSKGSKQLLQKVCKKFGIKAKGKKGKFPADPKAPKRPSSGFFLFTAENRPRVAKKCTGVGAIAKQLGQDWKNCNADVKAKFQAKAAKLKAAHTKVKTKYEKSKSFTNFQAARTEYNKLRKKL